MVCTDAQVRRMMREREAGKSQEHAAVKANVKSRKTVGYEKLGKVPSELKVPRRWRTRRDPFGEDWPVVEGMLAANSGLEAKTLVDWLVLARSVFHHSVNYRSAVIFGRGQLVADAQKMEYLKHFTEKLIPGRWDDARIPNPQEFKATSVVALTIESASAKIRTGPPKDDEEDYALPVWAGVLPIQQQFAALEADPQLTEGIAVPNYLLRYVHDSTT